MKEKNIHLHNRCQCEIRWRQFKNKTEPTAGLFCKHHDVFLDWLSTQDATLLIDNGINQTPYHDRKTAKKNKAKKSLFYKIAKKTHISAKKKLNATDRSHTSRT